LMGMALSLIMVLFVPSDGGGWFIWLFVTIPLFFNPAIHDLKQAMLADVVDYDQLLWANKDRREGIFTILLQGLPIGASVQSIILVVWVLIGLDLHSKKGTQSEFTEHWLRISVLFGMVPLVLGALLLFWYPITTRVHQQILQGVSERVYTVEPASVTPVLDPIKHRLLVTIPKQDIRTQFLNHCATAELRIWLRLSEAGYRRRASWLLRLLLMFELFILLGAVSGLIYLGASWGTKSDYFTLFVLGSAVLGVASVLQSLRLFATKRLSEEDCSTEEVRAHITQLRELY